MSCPHHTERPPAVSGGAGTEIQDQCDQGELGAEGRVSGEGERGGEDSENALERKG